MLQLKKCGEYFEGHSGRSQDTEKKRNSFRTSLPCFALLYEEDPSYYVTATMFLLIFARHIEERAKFKSAEQTDVSPPPRSSSPHHQGRCTRNFQTSVCSDHLICFASSQEEKVYQVFDFSLQLNSPLTHPWGTSCRRGRGTGHRTARSCARPTPSNRRSAAPRGARQFCSPSRHS